MKLFIRRALIGLGLIAWTWIWWFPIAGFHHMLRCGLLGWAILDGENEAFEIRWSFLLLVMTAAIWLGGVLAVRAVYFRKSLDRIGTP